jgi:TonB family protein
MGKIPLRSYRFYFVIVLLLHLLVAPFSSSLKNVNEKRSFPEKKPLVVQLNNDLKQVVESKDSPDDQINVKKRFLSDKSRTFNRESVALKNPSRNLTFSDLRPDFKGNEILEEREKKVRFFTTSDYVEGIKEGSETQLNTAEFKYYSFFKRIKEKMEPLWWREIQKVSLKLKQRGRNFLTSKLTTFLRIKLNKRGELIGVHLVESAGVQEFDSAALEAVQLSAPFNNPPKGLIKNEVLEIDWGFIVKGLNEEN